mgnify:FL=1
MNALKLESGKTRFWYRRLLQVQNKTTGQIYLQYYGGGAIDLDADRFKNKLEAFWSLDIKKARNQKPNIERDSYLERMIKDNKLSYVYRNCERGDHIEDYMIEDLV